MKLTKDDIAYFIDMLDQAEDFRPLVRKVIDVVKSYGPELDEIMSAILKKSREGKVNDIFYYESKGCSRMEAILLTLDTRNAIRDCLEKWNKEVRLR